MPHESPSRMETPGTKRLDHSDTAPFLLYGKTGVGVSFVFMFSEYHVHSGIFNLLSSPFTSIGQHALTAKAPIDLLYVSSF